jgi:hypothetical protein
MALFKESDVRAAGLKSEQYFSKSSEKILMAEVRDIPLDRAFNIFLCHSFEDAQPILGLETILEDMGYTVYIDHQVDPQLNRQQVTQATANQLRARMQHSAALFYVTSSNSPHSKWMPWELGYFDGLKSRASILPLVSDYTLTDEYSGQEYLGIYPYITRGPTRGVPAEDRLWVNWSQSEYILFEEWLRGREPIIH